MAAGVAPVLHRTDLHAGAVLALSVGESGCGNHLTWLFLQIGEAKPLVDTLARGLLEGDAPMTRLLEGPLARLDATSTATAYLLGERFLAVDVLFMALLEQAGPLLPPGAARDACVARAQRPARERAATSSGTGQLPPRPSRQSTQEDVLA